MLLQAEHSPQKGDRPHYLQLTGKSAQDVLNSAVASFSMLRNNRLRWTVWWTVQSHVRTGVYGVVPAADATGAQ